MVNQYMMYGFPLSFDIIVSTLLFVGRHALASQGYSERAVGSIVLVYGIGYVVSCLLMPRINTPANAKRHMLLALGGLVAISLVLANTQILLIIQILYCLFPFFSSLLFNSFQIFMLDISNQNARPLSITAGHFTLAWSVGFAIGPFISSVLKNAFAWSQIYYLVAVMTAGIGLMLYVFQPHKSPESARKPPVAPAHTGSSLIGPAWVGLLFGWLVLNTIMVYWPVQAVQLSIPAAQRGYVEFSYALTQGVVALLLTYVPRWHYKLNWLVLLGACGVVSLGIFALSAGTLSFVLAAVFYGIFTGGMFSFVVYHAMIEEEKAVRRVAINETLVGITYLLASRTAIMLHTSGSPFGPSYLYLGLMLAIGVTAQVIYAGSLLRRTHRIPVEA